MGVEFAHLLIPRDNTVRPTADRLAHLLAAWQADGRVPTASQIAQERAEFTAAKPPDSLKHLGFSIEVADRQFADLSGLTSHEAFERHDEQEFLLTWPCNEPIRHGLAFPLNFTPRPHAYYDLQLLVADDFIHMADESIDPLDPVCACGEALQYWPRSDPFYASRIRRLCPQCGRAFRPQDQSADYRDPVTGEVTPLPGGACFRFAIRIEAGKGLNPLPRIDGRLPRATPEFLGLCERVLGVPLYEVGYLY